MNSEGMIRRLLAPETGAVILDTETTGLHDSAEVIELGIIRAATGEVLCNQRFKPYGEMNPESRKIHGISVGDLAACPRFAERIAEVRRIIEGVPVIVWYADFDKDRLRHEFTNAGAGFGRCFEDWHCASVLYHLAVYGDTALRVRLAGACEAEGVVHSNPHSALGDVCAVRRVLLSARARSGKLEARPVAGRE